MEKTAAHLKPEDPENGNVGRAVPTAEGKDDPEGKEPRQSCSEMMFKKGNKKEKGEKLSVQVGNGGVKTTTTTASLSQRSLQQVKPPRTQARGWGKASLLGEASIINPAAEACAANNAREDQNTNKTQTTRKEVSTP